MYNASPTPLLIAIDGSGVVRAARPIVAPKDLRALIQAAVAPPPTEEAEVTLIASEQQVALPTELRAQVNGGGRIT